MWDACSHARVASNMRYSFQNFRFSDFPTALSSQISTLRDRAGRVERRHAIEIFRRGGAHAKKMDVDLVASVVGSGVRVLTQTARPYSDPPPLDSSPSVGGGSVGGGLAPHRSSLCRSFSLLRNTRDVLTSWA